jgi:gliding motility-associated-like protein
MKKVLRSTVCIFFFVSANAQVNLITNPSFESYSSCPSNYGELTNAIPWLNPTTLSPDFFHPCGANFYCTAPSNNYGYQVARTGIGYAGIYVSQVIAAPNVNEYLRMQLSETLKPNVNYCLEYYVSLCDSAKSAIYSFGAFFSANNATPMNGYVMNVVPQIVNDINNPLLDKNNWMAVKGVYLASGGEEYVTIGNFYTDQNSGLQIVMPTGQYDYSFYYIDDISVVESNSSGTCILEASVNPPPTEILLEMPNVFTPNNDGKNDDFVPAKLQGIISAELLIYNRWGEQLLSTRDLLAGWDGLFKGKTCPDGIYYWTLNYTTTLNESKELKGFVQLVKE